MATEKTDVVMVGVGAAGGVLAAELGKAGMKVIGLERGPRLKTADFQLDELRYFQRQELRPDKTRQPATRQRAPAGARGTQARAAGGPDPDAELRQPGGRRPRPLRRGVVAAARGRF